MARILHLFPSAQTCRYTRRMMKIVRHPDSRLIDSLGGPAQLARLLGMTKPGSVQRIVNWRRRGIPYRVKVENAQIFMTAMLKDQP